MYIISFPVRFLCLEEHDINHGFDFLCLQSWAIKPLFVFLCCPGAVLLVSVQGIAVNVDPVFCTWLLYQPHRGREGRQQQQVPDHLSRSQTKSFLFLDLGVNIYMVYL